MKRLSLALVFSMFFGSAFAAFNKVENFPFSNISATTGAFTLRGGNYGVTCHATFGGGNIVLQRLAPDGTSWVAVITAMTVDGYASANLPSGSYRLAITTATAVYCDVVATVTTQ